MNDNNKSVCFVQESVIFVCITVDADVVLAV